MGQGDHLLLLEAQASCSHELDAMPIAAILQALQADGMVGWVLEGTDRQMLVTAQMQGKDAMLTCGYRVGSTQPFLADCRALLTRLMDDLDRRGVQHVFLCVSMKNPNFKTLWKLFRRLGFGPDLVRMERRV